MTNLTDEVRTDHAVAVGCRHVLHGFRRHYGTEDVVRGAGYAGAILILLLTPVIWSLPTAFMIGELASALPEEGGYYAGCGAPWGNCWGFQEAWLSLVASVFDMAIYPTLFVVYLERLFPWPRASRECWSELRGGPVCAALNIAGIKASPITSVWLFFLLSRAVCRHRGAATGSMEQLSVATPTTSHVHSSPGYW